MAPGLCSCWTFLWTVVVFRTVFADPTYFLHDSQVTFDSALKKCAPGFLTTFATKQEIREILSFISGSVSPQGNFTFWVGLKKDKKDCVDRRRPLRGFKWTETRSEDTEEARWLEEPESTCTSMLCAALRVELHRSQAIRWDLISVRCKSSHRFICKLTHSRTGQTPDPRETSTGRATSEPGPTTSEPKAKTPQIPNTEPGTPEPKLLTLEPQVPKPTTGPKQVGRDHGLGSAAAVGSESCTHPFIPESRSISPDSDNNRIQVDCWSSDRLELYCVAHLATWFLPDNSPANLSSICQRCRVGFRKNASANCVDIDECSNGHAHCEHTCLNTEGSYRCVCVDGTGRHQQNLSACADSVAVEDGGPLSGLLIPVLVAVVTLVVLVVVALVTVKCCLAKRSKKKAEKMAMKNKDHDRT